MLLLEKYLAQPKPTTDPRDRIVVDASAEQRLADILKRALSTPSSRHGNEPKREKPAKAKESRRHVVPARKGW